MGTIKTTIVILVCLLLIGCAAKTDEEKIEKAMKEYVKANFANTNDYQGIVSTSLLEEIDFVSVADGLLDQAPTFDSICKHQSDYFDRVNNWSLKVREETDSWACQTLLDRERKEFTDCLTQFWLSDVLYNDSLYCSRLDSLLKVNTFEPLKHYEVNVKVRQEGKIEYVTMNYHAYVFAHGDAFVTNKDGNNYDMNKFHIKDKEQYTMLIGLSTEILEHRTNKLKAIEDCNNAAESLKRRCYWVIDY